MHTQLSQGPGFVALAFGAGAVLDNVGRFFAVLETELSHTAARRAMLRLDGLEGRALLPIWKSFEFRSAATDAVETAFLVGPPEAHTWLERFGRMAFPEAELSVGSDETAALAALRG